MLVWELQSGMTKGLTHLTDVKVRCEGKCTSIDWSVDWSEKTCMGNWLCDEEVIFLEYSAIVLLDSKTEVVKFSGLAL